jgi:hypothetical protein
LEVSDVREYVQPFEGAPQLVNVAHIVKLSGEMLKLSDGTTMRASPESVLRLHALLPKLEG